MAAASAGAAPAEVKPGQRAARAAGDGRQATLFSLAKVVVLEDLAELRRTLKSSDATEGDLVAALTRLAAMPMSEKALRATRVGRAVNALTTHRVGRVRTLAKRLVRQWKALVLAPPPRREKAQPPAPVTEQERVRTSCRATLAARIAAAAPALTAAAVEAVADDGERAVWTAAGKRTGTAHGRVLRAVVMRMDADAGAVRAIAEGATLFADLVKELQHQV